MVIYFENALSRDDVFEFDYEAVAKQVCEAVLENQNCPFDCEIDIMLTDNETIRSINKETRNIDRETDVLSFPNLFFEAPAEFDIAESEICDFVNPENDMVVLGDYCLFQSYILIGSRFGQLFMTLSAPSAAIAAWVLLGEAMTPLALLGMLVTLTGIGISVLNKGGEDENGKKRKLKLKLPVKGVIMGVCAGMGQGIGLVLSKVGMGYYEASIAAQGVTDIFP